MKLNDFINNKKDNGKDEKSQESEIIGINDDNNEEINGHLNMASFSSSDSLIKSLPDSEIKPAKKKISIKRKPPNLNQDQQVSNSSNIAPNQDINPFFDPFFEATADKRIKSASNSTKAPIPTYIEGEIGKPFIEKPTTEVHSQMQASKGIDTTSDKNRHISTSTGVNEKQKLNAEEEKKRLIEAEEDRKRKLLEAAEQERKRKLEEAQAKRESQKIARQQAIKEEAERKEKETLKKAEELFSKTDTDIKFKEKWMEVYKKSLTIAENKRSYIVKKCSQGRFSIKDDKIEILPDMDLSGKSSAEILNIEWKIN